MSISINGNDKVFLDDTVSFTVVSSGSGIQLDILGDQDSIITSHQETGSDYYYSRVYDIRFKSMGPKTIRASSFTSDDLQNGFGPSNRTNKSVDVLYQTEQDLVKLPHYDIHEAIFGELKRDYLSSVSPPCLLYTEDFTEISETVHNHGRVSVITNKTETYFQMGETPGNLKINFFYKSGEGQKAPLKWANYISNKLQYQIIKTHLQFQVGNIQFLGRDRNKKSYSIAIYTLPFCYYKNL